MYFLYKLNVLLSKEKESPGNKVLHQTTPCWVSVRENKQNKTKQYSH